MEMGCIKPCSYTFYTFEVKLMGKILCSTPLDHYTLVYSCLGGTLRCQGEGFSSRRLIQAVHSPRTSRDVFRRERTTLQTST